MERRDISKAGAARWTGNTAVAPFPCFFFFLSWLLLLSPHVSAQATHHYPVAHARTLFLPCLLCVLFLLTPTPLPYSPPLERFFVMSTAAKKSASERKILFSSTFSWAASWCTWSSLPCLRSCHTSGNPSEETRRRSGDLGPAVGFVELAVGVCVLREACGFVVTERRAALPKTSITVTLVFVEGVMWSEGGWRM